MRGSYHVFLVILLETLFNYDSSEFAERKPIACSESCGEKFIHRENVIKAEIAPEPEAESLVSSVEEQVPQVFGVSVEVRPYLCAKDPAATRGHLS